MDENRRWVENIPCFEVYGMEDNIIEGAEAYFTALSKYQTAIQTQIISIFLIFILSVVIIASGRFLFRIKK
ncbi:MAG: hypothetical protein ACFFA6_10905 [Promethearchaeota archaeon]